MEGSGEKNCNEDEIFRGTNSAERIPTAIEVLRYFTSKNILCVIATHDLEVAKACTDIYSLYHFSELVGAQGLEFDYRLYKGIATTRNAIRILEFMGFPDDIVLQAKKRLIIMTEMENLSQKKSLTPIRCNT